MLLLWRYNSKPGSGDGYSKAPLAFLLSFVPGIIFGAIYSAATIKDPEGVKRNPELWDSLQVFNMGEGMYKTFLGVNVVGHIVCLSGTVIGFLLHQYVPALQLGGCDGEATTEDPQTGKRVPTAGYEAHHRAGTVGELPVDGIKAEVQVAVPSAVSVSSA